MSSDIDVNGFIESQGIGKTVDTMIKRSISKMADGVDVTMLIDKKDGVCFQAYSPEDFDCDSGEDGGLSGHFGEIVSIDTMIDMELDGSICVTTGKVCEDSLAYLELLASTF